MRGVWPLISALIILRNWIIISANEIGSHVSRTLLMVPSQYPQLYAIAHRLVDDMGEAQDIVQEAYLAAFLSGFTDFDSIDTRKWLMGVVRNKARMALRTAVRRRGRESQWQVGEADVLTYDQQEIVQLLNRLTPSLKAVLALALSGHNKTEIAYLLNLTDAALRQRICALKNRILAEGIAMPGELPGLNPQTLYGRIRVALLSKLSHGEGLLASHDPDGHLFIIRRSQN